MFRATLISADRQERLWELIFKLFHDAFPFSKPGCRVRYHVLSRSDSSAAGEANISSGQSIAELTAGAEVSKNRP